MKYYYANTANQATGPVSLDDLSKLLAAGQITLSTNVIPEGSQRWHPLSEIPQFAPKKEPTPTPAAPKMEAKPLAAPVPSKPATDVSPTPPAPTPATVRPETPHAIANATKINYPTVLGSLVGNLLGKTRGLLTAGLVDRVLSFCQVATDWLVLVGTALALLSALIFAVRMNEFVIFLAGIAGVIAIAVLQYISKRFSAACTAVSKYDCTLSSSAVPDTIGLLSIIFAVIVLLYGIYIGIRTNEFTIVITSVFVSSLLALLAAVSLNPSVLKLTITPSSPGEEATGLVSFFMKILLIALPVVTFLLAAAGALIGVSALFDRPLVLLQSLQLVGRLLPYQLQGLSLTVTALLFPALTYITFLVLYLLIDIVRSIVCVPGKLDALRNKS
ncbi:MAG: DUF4339 domain-containing protein [Nibricoccus sp.]